MKIGRELKPLQKDWSAARTLYAYSIPACLVGPPALALTCGYLVFEDVYEEKYRPPKHVDTIYTFLHKVLVAVNTREQMRIVWGREHQFTKQSLTQQQNKTYFHSVGRILFNREFSFQPESADLRRVQFYSHCTKE